MTLRFYCVLTCSGAMEDGAGVALGILFSTEWPEERNSCLAVCSELLIFASDEHTILAGWVFATVIFGFSRSRATADFPNGDTCCWNPLRGIFLWVGLADGRIRFLRRRSCMDVGRIDGHFLIRTVSGQAGGGGVKSRPLRDQGNREAENHGRMDNGPPRARTSDFFVNGICYGSVEARRFSFSFSLRASRTTKNVIAAVPADQTE